MGTKSGTKFARGTLGRMVRILGIPLSDDGARWLIDGLYRDAHAPAVSAAHMLEKGVDRNLYAIGLSREERTAILGVLDDPPAGTLAELRGVLLRERN